jgi:hypothetical protein
MQGITILAMVSYLLSFILLGIVQIFTAVWGGIVSVKSLPVSEKKMPHVLGFVFLGLFGVVLILWIGYQTYAAEREAKISQERAEQSQIDMGNDLKEARTKLDQSVLAQEFMKGQLSGLAIVLGKMQDNGTLGAKQVAGAIEKMAQSNAQTTALSNKQLCTQTTALTKRMLAFEYRWHSARDQMSDRQSAAMREASGEGARKQLWNQQTRELIQSSQQENYEFRSTMLGEAIYLKDELLKRLPGEAAPEQKNLIAFEGSTAGVSAIGDAANYLDALANKLCH